jgi:hypothetical protein
LPVGGREIVELRAVTRFEPVATAGANVEVALSEVYNWFTKDLTLRIFR